MFNIEFKAGKTDTAVAVEIETDTPCYRPVIRLFWDTGFQITAQLLRSHCEKELRKAIRNLVKRAYEQGLVDGKNHRQVKTDFVESLVPSDVIGW